MIPTNIVNQYDHGRRQPRDPDAVIDWDVLLRNLSSGLHGWLTVVRSDGVPSVRPVLAVLVDEAVHVTSSPAARKTRELAAGTTATFATSSTGLD